MTNFLNILLIFSLTLLLSCDIELIPKKEKKITKIENTCTPIFNFNKSTYTFNDLEIVQLFDRINKNEELINSKDTKITEKVKNKFGSFLVYKKGGENIKISSDIYIKDLNLSSSKHEIFFIDDCNIVAKMTKYAYRSKRIKSIYFFLITNNNFVGCIVTHHHSLFRKKDKWFNISDEKLALNWSNRIFHNIIKPHLKQK